MAITPGYIPMSLRQAKTLQPVVPHTVSVPMIQPMQEAKTEPNLSKEKTIKVSETEPKLQPATVTQQQSEPQEKSTKRFALRLTTKQRNQVRRLQKSWGLSTESAVVKKLIEDAKEEKNTNDLALQIQELTQIKAELNRIGVNINQISKRANQLQMTTDDLNAVVKYMNDVCELIYKKGLK